MKILFLCHRFPYPPKNGGNIRSFHMIKHLSRSHQVTVMAPVRSRDELEAGAGLAEYCEHYVTGLLSGPWPTVRMIGLLPTWLPSSIGYFYSPELRRSIRSALAEQHFDLIIVHCSSVAHYVADVGTIPKILDFCDMDSQKWLIYAKHYAFPRSVGYWLEGTKLERTERKLAACFDISTCATRAEIETLNRIAPDAQAAWFPNGVDYEYFCPDPEGTDYDPDLLSFIGRMDYFPNEQCMIDFCSKVLPRIRERRPQTRMVIVGADPTAKVRALGSLPGVTVTGSVPDVRPYIRNSAVMVAPLQIARGVQNKLLEAMAMGVPVVTSELAAKGADVVPGEHLLAASSARQLADCVLGLLENPDERRRFAEAGRARVLERHDWDSAMKRLDGIVEQGVNLFTRKRFATIVATELDDRM